MIKYFDANSIEAAKRIFRTANSGFRYGFIADIFPENIYQELMATFPDVKQFKLVDKMSGGGHKRFYIAFHYDVSKNRGCWCHLRFFPAIWQKVLQEAASSEFIDFLSSVTEVKANSLATFGHTYGNEGCVQEPHIDGAVREDRGEYPSTLATLIYFNEKPDNTGGTCVYATDRKTILFQAPSMRNGMFFFEQHPDAWHGFPMMPTGAERRLVSLAYGLEDQSIRLKNSLFHRLTCVPSYKRILKRLIR